MYYVYVICNIQSKELYVGYTKDLKRRLEEHNSKQNRSTRRKSEWRLIYYEAFLSKSDATTRESKLKQHGRARQELFKRLEESISEC